MMGNVLCPCGSGSALDGCCGPYLAGEAAPTAAALMRSRYTAYTRADIDYLMQTTHAERRDLYNADEMRAWAVGSEWLGLEVVRTKQGGPQDLTGVVEFKATFNENGERKVHHEVSRFKREAGRWFFLDGKVTAARPVAPTKVGRNDPCPCGSGRKYKKCCG